MNIFKRFIGSSTSKSPPPYPQEHDFDESVDHIGSHLNHSSSRRKGRGLERPSARRRPSGHSGEYVSHVTRSSAQPRSRPRSDFHYIMDNNDDPGVKTGDETFQEAPSSPISSTPGSYFGTNGYHSQNSQEPPVPPPHQSPRSPDSRSAEQSVMHADQYKALGNKFFKAKQFDRAIEEYTKAIEADPASSTYLSNRAAAYISANNFVAALEDAKAADELEPKNSKIMHRLARIYTSLGRSRDALETYSRIEPPASATDTAPAKSMQDYISQAEKQVQDGRGGSMVLHALDQAERGLGSTVPPPRKWRLLRGEAYLKMGTVNALGDAQNAVMGLLRENSQDPEALVLRGRVLYAQGENEKAIQHFKNALGLDPDFKDGLKYLRMVQKLDRMKEEGNSFFKTGKYTEAVDTYTKALEVDPSNKQTNAKLLQNRAICNSKLKDFEAAISDCDQAIRLDPSYTKARRTRAKALGESGDWEAAVRDLKEVAESNPSEPGLQKEIRNAELELKKSKRKDYYKILGLEKDCQDDEIKKAYRKLAIQTHPDKNPDDPKAEMRFKDVGEAYENLSDPQKRQRYDSGVDLQDPSEMFGGGMGGFGGFPGGMGGMGGGMQIDPEMLFNMMGGGGGSMGGMGGRGGGPTFTFQTGGPRGRGGGGFPF